jgi:multiple sugar transport system permease protein
MSTSTPAPTTTSAPPTTGRPGRRRVRRFSRTDKVVLGLMVGIPTLVHVMLVWVPALASIGLSFTQWNGIGGLSSIQWNGTKNYQQIFSIYPPFWPAVRHNVIWLLVFLLLAAPVGLFLAYLLDKNLKGSRLYQSAFFLPVVLSLALIGFIWTLVYQQQQGLLNSLLGDTSTSAPNWLGDPNLNLWAILVAASWRQIGYIMILYLAGLKGVDPSLKEAAAIDGANEWQTFRRVIFPSLRPINIVVLVVTIIESLRAFDIVYVINGGRNGLELLSVLVTQNIIGEASRIGYGSAIAVILLVIAMVPILTFLVQTFRKETR